MIEYPTTPAAVSFFFPFPLNGISRNVIKIWCFSVNFAGKHIFISSPFGDFEWYSTDVKTLLTNPVGCDG